MNQRTLVAIVAALTLVVAACGSDDTAGPATSPAPSATAGADSGADPNGSTDGGTVPNDEPDADGNAATADCPPPDGTDQQTQTFDAAPPQCLDPDATYEAVVTTNKGEFTIALEPESAPQATNNFVFLARNRYYDDTTCHRIIPDFVVQCGDPDGTGMGGPGYTIVDEPPAPGQYRIGSIAMAKTQLPDSAGSQFFIITGSQGAALPPEYALFGQVIDGLDTTVEAMAAAGTPGDGVPSEPIDIQSIRIIQS